MAVVVDSPLVASVDFLAQTTTEDHCRAVGHSDIDLADTEGRRSCLMVDWEMTAEAVAVEIEDWALWAVHRTGSALLALVAFDCT